MVLATCLSVLAGFAGGAVVIGTVSNHACFRNNLLIFVNLSYVAERRTKMRIPRLLREGILYLMEVTAVLGQVVAA